MTWPPSPQQPDPTGGYPGPVPGQPPGGYPGQAPAQGGGSSLPIGALITGGSALLTLLFSFVRIVKVDFGFGDSGVSVWTTDFGLFGVGTWMPLLALVAGALALVRGFVQGFDGRSIGTFTPLQLQMVAALVPVLVWIGYLINIVMADGLDFGLGMLLLFVGLAGVVAGTVFDVVQTGVIKPMAGVPGAPGPGAWPGGDPTGGTPAPASGTWQTQGQAPAQGTPAPPPAPAGGDWTQQPQAAPAPPPAPGGDWTQQPQAAPAPPPPPPQAPAPPPAGGPPAGGPLIDPGTQVIPGPPPAPPAPGDQDTAGADDGTGGLPPIPPSNT